MALPQLLKDLAQTCKSKPIESGRCSYEESGPVHVVLARDDISMGILVSNAQVYGLSFLIQKISPTVAISGGFYSSITSLRCKLLGEIVRDGKLVQKGEPGSTYAYMVYTSSGVYGFGQGITPRTYKGKIVKEGLGGLIPIIIGGKQITAGADNWYKIGNIVTGRCIVGHNPSKHLLLVIAQEHKAPKFNLDEFREFSADLGCTDVVGLDGSNSAMLWYQNVWKFTNDRLYKDSWNESAVVFSTGMCFIP